MRPRVAIVGGGISGLSAAHELIDRAPSIDVLLLEAGSRLGGVVETTRRDGFLIEAAADGFLTSPPTAVDLCRQVGLESSLTATDPTRRQAFVVHHNRLQPIPAGFTVVAPSRIWPMLASPILSVRGKLRMGLEYFVPQKTSDDDESLASFIRRRFGREMHERLVQPLVGGIYATDSERLSLDATMPCFRAMEREHGSLIRAAVRQRRQPRDNSSGARYGQFASLREGMGSLVASLAARLPPQSVRLDSPVDRIVSRHGRKWLLLTGGDHPQRLEVDGIILATPAHHAARIVASLDSLFAAQLAQIPYSSCAVVSLGYRRDQIDHALNGAGLVVPLAERRSILSCSFSSVKYEGRAPHGAALLRVVIGGACQSDLLRMSDDRLIELAESEVMHLLGIRGAPTLRYLTRHHRALPQYLVGHREHVATIDRQLARFSTLALAGSGYAGVGVPACIRSGQVAAEKILVQLNYTTNRSKVTRPETAAVA